MVSGLTWNVDLLILGGNSYLSAVWLAIIWAT
jgi:hypothetical protein